MTEWMKRPRDFFILDRFHIVIVFEGNSPARNFALYNIIGINDEIWYLDVFREWSDEGSFAPAGRPTSLLCSRSSPSVTAVLCTVFVFAYSRRFY